MRSQSTPGVGSEWGMEELQAILEGVRPDLDFDREEGLVENGTLDSFDIISIILEVNETFEISINAADLQPKNFDSKQAIWALIQKNLGG